MDSSASSDGPLATLFPQHLRTWGERLQRGLAAAGFDAAVVFSGAEKTAHRDDIRYPFRVEPYFKAWLPLTRHPGSLLRLTPGERPVLVYLQPDDYWHQPPQDPEGFWVEHFDIRYAATPGEASKALGGGLARLVAIGERVERAEEFGAVNDPALLKHLDFYRAFKTPYEIACLERANLIGARGHLAVQRAFAEGASEFELHQVYCEATAQRETELPYPSIVALNEHASILHYQNLEHVQPRPIRSFLIDAGAEFNGYASDITRTAANEAPEFEVLIAEIDSMQQALCAALRSGLDFVELNAEAHRLLAGILAQHRLIECSAEQACAEGITRTFLPHGLGHLLGLQVHDAGGRQRAPDGAERAPPREHPHLRLTRVLEPGFVVTIEPGLYFVPSLLKALADTPAGRRVNWEAVERLIPCGGIRVEDDVLVEQDGALNLTRQAFDAARSGNVQPKRNAPLDVTSH